MAALDRRTARNRSQAAALPVHLVFFSFALTRYFTIRVWWHGADYLHPNMGRNHKKHQRESVP